MKLELAIVSECNAQGCRVTLVKNDAPIEAKYASLVYDQIHIEPNQLVALNTAVEPPEVVWRWLRGVLIKHTDELIIVDDLKGHPAEVTIPEALPLDLNVNDEVWTCGTGSGYEIHGRCMGGKPDQPDQILQTITPIITRIYQS